ncbi:hypothetical protein BHE74_00049216 [Ensete ventricosum]|nr:hypothetical protein BHE74_00049216 [Ensete ventricosum]
MAKPWQGNPLSLLLLPSQVVLALPLLLSLRSAVESKCVLFNFGDSNSDTGGFAAGLGFYLGPPSGRQFFHKTTGRFGDGRLYIDFICEGLKMSYLSHYLESSGSNFSHGVNFAVVGAAVDLPGNPFPLSTQVLQFLHFKNRTRELMAEVTEKEFKDAVYSIDIGQNDLAKAFYLNLSYPQVLLKIPTMINKIEDAIKNDSQLDAFGCLLAYNDAAKAYNSGLRDLCEKMRQELKNAVIVYIDMFSIKYDLIANHTQYKRIGKMNVSFFESSRHREAIDGLLWPWRSAVQLQGEDDLRATYGDSLPGGIPVCELGWSPLY